MRRRSFKNARSKRHTEPETGKNLIGYARVSTQEQNLEMQIDALIRAGVPRNHIVVEKVSAAAKRKALDEIFDGLREGDELVVWKMDRLARNLKELIERMERIRALGCGFRSISEQIDVSTPAGKLLFHVVGALAEFERDLVIERTKAGVRRAMADGVKFGADPKLKPEDVKAAQKMRDGGQSIRTIAKQFKVSHNTIRNWTVAKSK